MFPLYTVPFSTHLISPLVSHRYIIPLWKYFQFTEKYDLVFISRRYKKHFKVTSRPGINKTQLADTLTRCSLRNPLHICAKIVEDIWRRRIRLVRRHCKIFSS